MPATQGDVSDHADYAAMSVPWAMFGNLDQWHGEKIAVRFEERQTNSRVSGSGYIWGIGAKTKRTAQMTMRKATNITAYRRTRAN